MDGQWVGVWQKTNTRNRQPERTMRSIVCKCVGHSVENESLWERRVQASDLGIAQHFAHMFNCHRSRNQSNPFRPACAVARNVHWGCCGIFVFRELTSICQFTDVHSLGLQCVRTKHSINPVCVVSGSFHCGFRRFMMYAVVLTW